MAAAILFLAGCAIHRGDTGFSYTFGQSGVCSGIYSETAEAWTCRGSYTHGGALSETAAKAGADAVGGARRAAGAAFGFPVP